MTQPISPFALPPAGPNQAAPLTPAPFDAPRPVIPAGAPAEQQGAEPYHDTWLEEYQREHAAENATKAQKEAHQRELESQHGYAETVSGKFLQGALDALLAPGAIVGLEAEAAGSVFKSKALHDFGRGLGQASSGRSAMEVMSAMVEMGKGGSALEGASAADEARASLDETEQAYPMLSTISRMAGMTALAVAGGAASSGETGAAANIISNAAEGAASGAQGGYEHDASLRDILVSTAIGGVIGGGISATAEGVNALTKRLPDLSEVFGQKLQTFADERAWKAVVDRDPAAMRDWMRWSPERRARIVDRIRAADILGKGDEEMLATLSKGASDAGEQLRNVANQLDEAGITPNIGDLRERLMQQTQELRASGSGTMASMADAIESETKPFMNKLAIVQNDANGVPVTVGYRNPSFTELRTFKQALGAAKSKHIRAQSLQADEIRSLYGNVAQTLDEAADHAGPAAGNLWRSSNEAATDFLTLKDALENQIGRKLKNRFFSPTDYGTSVAAGIATAVMHANPVSAALAMAGGAIGHKALREGGSALMSSLANRFARMSRHVPLVAAGGRESQEVLQAIAKTRAFVAETAERAGSNPALRQSGEEAARAVAAQELDRKAGGFVAEGWAEKPLKPLQKVLYRSQILDAASGDVAKVASALGELHPPLPETLDLKRLGRLMKDGDETAGIGSLQQLIDQSAQAAPNTPAGRSGKNALTALGRRLARTDGPESMATAHETANWLQQAQELAPDDISREYLARTEAAIRTQLAKPEWGQAGAEYAALTAPPHEILEHLAKPENVREVLRTGGDQMGAAMRSVRQRVEAAHDAFFRLTGRPTDPALRHQLNAAQKIMHAAESAVTLDGKPLAQVFDTANSAGVYAGTGQQTEPVNGETVRKNVVRGLDQVAPIIKAQATGGKMQKVGAIVRSAASEPATREQYDQRMKELSRAVAQPAEVATTPGMFAQIAPDTGKALAQLMNDIPKPSPSIRGKLFETLSDDQLRLANAMWEATTEPMSVMTDLARGDLDPDKAAYAWKQYPGLQKAVQAGVLDVLMGLSDEERSAVPTHILTQLDSALGFNGGLQDANEPSFSKRTDALYQPAPQKPQPGGMLENPKAEPTFTQRLAGAGS